MKKILARIRRALSGFMRLFILLLAAALILQYIFFSWLDKAITAWSPSDYELADEATFGGSGDK